MSLLRITHGNCKIHCSLFDDLSWDCFLSDGLDDFKNFENRIPLSGSEIPYVPDSHCLLLDPVICRYMPLDEITHIYIITDRCPIRSGERIPVDIKFGFFSENHIKYVGGKTPMIRSRKVSEIPRLMSSDKVKVSENSRMKSLLFRIILEQIFYVEFAGSIGICCTELHILSKWRLIRTIIDRSGTGKYNILYSKTIHDIKEYHRPIEIIIEVHIWVGRTLSECLQPGKMNYSIKAMLLKYFFESFSIANITLIKIGAISENFFYPLQSLSRTIDEIVENHRLVSCLFKCDNCMRSDVPRSASNEKCFFIIHRGN